MLKLLVGQVAIIILVFFAAIVSYFIYSPISIYPPILLSVWSLLFIPLWIWSRKNPPKAFTVALIIYIVSAVIKDCAIGGEYILPFLFHIYFIFSMVVGMNATVPAQVNQAGR
jgi:hypothetical protein